MVMTIEKFNEEIAKAREIIASWPKWKQDICRFHLKGSPTMPEPRKPVLDNYKDEY